MQFTKWKRICLKLKQEPKLKQYIFIIKLITTLPTDGNKNQLVPGRIIKSIAGLKLLFFWIKL